MHDFARILIDFARSLAHIFINFVTKEKHYAMDLNKPNKQQKANLQILEERMQLLDTISEIVNIEIDKREKESKDNHQHFQQKNNSFWKRLRCLFSL